MPLGLKIPLFADAFDELPNTKKEAIIEDQQRPVPVVNPATGNPMPPVEPQGPAEISNFPGIPGDEEANRNMTDSVNAENAFTRFIAPYASMGRIAPTVMEENENFHPLGGREDYNETFNRLPNQIAQSILAGGDAEAQMADKRAQFYEVEKYRQEQENAVMAQRMAERQNELAVRQKALDDATQRYSNDLADRGQYWKNPGNILAAFGAALMTLGSDDHAIGFKIINQAVQADFMQRKQLADMHLGELRSNLAGYRQLMGDANLGDKLALAEANRVAAMELDRISAQFQGPIAKAKAAAIANDFMKQSMLLKMQVHSQSVYGKPHVENPAILNAYKKGNTDGSGYTPYSSQGSGKGSGQGQTPSGNVPASGNQGSTKAPVQSSGSGQGAVQGPTSGSGQTSSKGGSKGGSKDVIVGGMTKELKERLDERSPGTADQAITEQFRAVEDAFAKAGIPPRLARPNMSQKEIDEIVGAYGKSKEYNNEIHGYRAAVDADSAEIAKAMKGVDKRIGMYRRMHSVFNSFEMTCRQKGIDVDDALGKRYDQLFGENNTKALDEFFAVGGKAGSAQAKQKEEFKKEAAFLKQLTNMNLVEWVNQKSGTTVSENEAARLKKAIDSTHSFNSLRKFFGEASASAQDEATTAINTGKTAAARTKWLIQVGQSNPQVSVTTQPPAVKGTARDPDIQRAAASKLFSPDQQKRISGGVR